LRVTLKKYEDFKLILSSGTRKVLNNIVVCYLSKQSFSQKMLLKSQKRHKDYELNDLVFGILTSKKMGKAHERNRFKRVVRASLDSCKINANFCYVFMPNLKPRSTGSIAGDVSYMAKKIS